MKLIWLTILTMACRYLCMRCCLTHKTHTNPRLRLDTLNQCLICAQCMHADLVKINLLGRVLRFRQQHFYFCPICTSIQQYQGQGEQPWVASSKCIHQPPTSNAQLLRKKNCCFICSEPALPHTIERVDHLSGKIVPFYYCQRHMPRPEALITCVNARQLAAYSPVYRR